jgi:hypothetical protein
MKKGKTQQKKPATTVTSKARAVTSSRPANLAHRPKG